MTNDLTLKVGFDIDKFQKELSKTNGMLNKWSTSIQSSLMGVAAGFSAMAVGQFVLDVSKLAGEAEGVRAAFDKLPNSVKVMQELKAATSGTVSELDLMKRAVTATNFGISMESLPKLLEFAAIRAKQTGQSVDYLVDSIVTGIGRKSPLILDNLGISTTRLKEKFGGAALEAQSIADVAKAVGSIAEEELGKMGSMSENASTKVERLGASWVNLKVALGDVINNSNALTGAIDSLTASVDLLASKNIGLLQKLMALINPAMAVSAIAEDLAKSAMSASAAQQKQNEITDTASVLLRDLGLDYEALMNVAGDNANVLEIWSEMQRLAAERTAASSAALNSETSALTLNTKAIKDNSDAEREARIAKLERSQAVPMPTGMAAVAGATNMQMPNFDTSAIDSMNSALASLVTQNNSVTESFNNQAISVYENAAALGEMLGSAVGASNGVAQAFANMASQVVKSIGNMIMAKMINAALDDKASNSFFPAKIALVGAAIATAQVLLRKIGSSSTGGGGVSAAGSGGGGGSRMSDGTRLESLGQRIEITGTIKASGKELALVLANQTRSDSRTKVG